MQSVDLKEGFDAAVFLTWSDWWTEPRSNRYHYATRLSRELPVIFVQATWPRGSAISERVKDFDITILHVGDSYDQHQLDVIDRELRARGIRRPLLWIYNVYFEKFVARSNSPLKIYHATEDYVTPSESFSITTSPIATAVRRLLKNIDLLVAVSDGVAESYRRHCNFDRKCAVLRNGCDFEFWHETRAYSHLPPANSPDVALFQGGINSRLDYKLLLDLADKLPNWQFWFCGKQIDAPPEWHELIKRPNVRNFGMLDPGKIAELARQSSVGLIPFKEVPIIWRSLPLKAYEYVACGLPVVSVPIEELSKRPDLFRIASGADDFASAIVEVSASRSEPDALAARLQAAQAESYGQRFSDLTGVIADALAQKRRTPVRGNVLLLYDDRSTHVRTIQEHLEAFQKYSRHNVLFMPATGILSGVDDSDKIPDLKTLDAIVIHYSVRLSVEEHLSKGLARAIARYNGPKILFIQDEYDSCEITRKAIEKLGIDTIFTCVPLEAAAASVYPRTRFPNVEFEPTLTGYVPEDPSLGDFAIPLEDRRVVIGYRGRQLPHQYGDLGYEKYRIGVDVRRFAEERGLYVDIEVDDSRRIYGNAWYRFVGSCRATLGTESGSNLFDHDGSLAKLAALHKDLPYPAFRERYLKGREGAAIMNQISPKVFEAIRLHTALVMFEGEYSGVVKPDVHYIALKKDYSNISEVFAKLEDIQFLKTLTDRAYQDVVASGRYSYARFVSGVDQYIDKRLQGQSRALLISVPTLVAFGGSSDLASLEAEGGSLPLVSDCILGPRLSRELYVSALPADAIEAAATAPAQTIAPPIRLDAGPAARRPPALVSRAYRQFRDAGASTVSAARNRTRRVIERVLVAFAVQARQRLHRTGDVDRRPLLSPLYFVWHRLPWGLRARILKELNKRITRGT